MSTVLKNYMEYCVDNSIDSVLKNIDCCKCPHCINDIKALALNALPTKYVVTDIGKLYTKIDSLKQQFDVDIVSALITASEKVSRRPRHDKQ